MNDDFVGLEERVRALGLSLAGPVSIAAEIDSTNDRAKEAARNDAPHGTIFIAESQTKGRGRQGRSWISPPGENLLLSIVVRLHRPATRLTTIPIVTGLALAEVVKRAVGDAPIVGLKWPNDILVDGKKIAGILVESVGKLEDPALVVGIGLNVHSRSFPEDLRATSIALHSALPPNRATVLIDLLGALDRDLPLAAGRGLSPFATRLAAADHLRGREVRSDAGTSGIARGIDDDGRLIVEDSQGTLHRWSSGEVHLLKV